MKKILVILFILSINFFLAQKKKDIKENITDFYSKTDSLPFFKFEKAELDTFIQIMFNYPLSARLMGIKFKDVVGFKIDRSGKVNSFTHYKTNLIMPKDLRFVNDEDEQTMYNSLKRESERILKQSEELWFSDSLRAKKEIIIFISVVPPEPETDEKNSVIYLMGSSGLNEMYNVGVRKFAIKKTLLAKTYFEQTAKDNPKDIDAHYNLAACCVKLKDHTKACENFKKCLELGDKSVEEQIKTYCK